MDTVRIRKMSLIDVGPFISLSINFPSDGLCLICGDNGIGKTTVLEALVATFSQGRLQRLKRREAAAKGSVEVSHVVNGADGRTTYQVDTFDPGTGDFVNALSNYNASVINIRASRDFSYSRQDTISRDPVFNSTHAAQKILNGIDPLEIKAWFSNRYLLRPHAATSSWTPAMLGNLDAAISFFSLLDPSVRLDRVDVKTFEIMVSTPNGIIPFEYLSSGFRSAYILLLGILKEIEFRNLDVSAREFSGIIAVDEIDLHLHPTWQREIGTALKNAFPQAQIIATTHSPHVIQSAQANEVIALVRDDKGNVSARPVPSGNYGYAGWTLEEVLEDIMGVEDTKTPIFRDAMLRFDEAIDKGRPAAIKKAVGVLKEMLHPNSPLRKLIDIQAAPYVGASDNSETSL